MTKEATKENPIRCFSFNPSSALEKNEAIELGLPETIMGSHLNDYLGTFLHESGDYYLPPISKWGLAKLLKANAYHGAMPGFKSNLFMRPFMPTKVIDTQDLYNAYFDFAVFGECYFYVVKNFFGQVIKYKHIMAINMRVKTDLDFRLLKPNGVYDDFYHEDIIQIKQYSPIQNIYGEPYYLGAIQSILLNEAATLFRRKYYLNGAHAGYVFYVADPDMTEDDEIKLKSEIASSKGAGNFRSLFINIPNGKEKAVQILPIGDFSSKDDMANIKNITRDDIIAAWRVPPALANILPSNTGGLGDIEKTDRVYVRNEIVPDRQKFLVLNDELPEDVWIRFDSSKDSLEVSPQ